MKKFSSFTINITTTFRAEHGLDRADRDAHWHTWTVTARLKHEVNTVLGWTFSMMEVQRHLESVTKELDERNLSCLFKVATAEVIAAYILSKLPAFYDSVQLSHLPNWSCEIERKDLSAEWLEGYML